MNYAITLRTKTEINREAFSKGQRSELVNRIYESNTVSKVLSWQTEDGYFNERMHTPESGSKRWSHEGCIRFLMEHGLTTEDEPIRKAIPAMLKPDWEES